MLDPAPREARLSRGCAWAHARAQGSTARIENVVIKDKAKFFFEAISSGDRSSRRVDGLSPVAASGRIPTNARNCIA